ncbi:hypothetical protein LJB42_004629 [Komagataella kurtzmanii]|nr:hypothetical protein LJB42_004629 [Komagataella kurtzmanii]
MDLITNCLSYIPCLSFDPILKINGVNYKIERLLGEGGFSYVYLVKNYNGQYALKKITCPFGNENLKVALQEVSNYKEFNSPFIVRSIDYSVVSEKEGYKTVYILLPFFETGIQDIITDNALNDTQIDEKVAIRMFIDICRGLHSMHRHHRNAASDSNAILLDTDSDAENQSLINNDFGTELNETTIFAHGDLKPSNIMLSKDETPVICDLGSCQKMPINITSFQHAISIQELVEEHCTLPYRAPELFDIKSGDTITESIDIWSLGCTLYALLYGLNPFEREEQINGANITLAINAGKYTYPDGDYTQKIKSLIDMCLVVDQKERPSIETVLATALGTTS